MGSTAIQIQTWEWEQARSLVLQTVQAHLPSFQIEQVSLLEAHGRVLAANVVADRDYPALARSLRDGFAVHANEVPGTLRVIGESRAGASESADAVPAGCALEIMTGAPMPAGADAVVMVEYSERQADQVVVSQKAEPGQFINVRGAETRKGAILVPLGSRLDASHIATLAMTGHDQVTVYRKPKVAILSTGDELVPVTQTPEPHQIRNSNSYSLAALVQAAGGEPVILPVAPDNEEGLIEALQQGLGHDLLLISGGVSAGKYDLVKPCLRKLGAEFLFERVRIQPGQPTAFGRVGDKFVFGLPGNPGSSMVTFQLFARTALELLAGQQESILPVFEVKFAVPFKHKGGLTRFLPARLNDNGLLTHVSWQGSSDIPALARANLFLIADSDRQTWNAGEAIRVMLKP